MSALAPLFCGCGARLPCATCTGTCKVKDCKRPPAAPGGRVLDRCAWHAVNGTRLDKFNRQASGVAALPPMVAPAGSAAFRVPGAPVTKNDWHAPTHRGARGIMVTPKARDWMLEVGLCAVRARPQGWSLDGKFSIEVISTFISPLADSSGPLELVKDALQGVLYVNDRQVRRSVGDFGADHPNPAAPRLECTVRRLP